METQQSLPRTEKASPQSPQTPQIRLEMVETYRSLPIHHLVYAQPVILDRAAHEEEIRSICAIPAERFGLAICARNVSFATDYTPADQLEVYGTHLLKPMKDRLLAVARYESGSFSTMIRSMSAHLHVGIPFFMSIAPDLESALRAVRRGIDQRLAAR